MLRYSKNKDSHEKGSIVLFKVKIRRNIKNKNRKTFNHSLFSINSQLFKHIFLNIMRNCHIEMI